MGSHLFGKNKRTIYIFAGFAIVLVILFFVALMVGKYTIGFNDFLKHFLRQMTSLLLIEVSSLI